MIPTQTTPPPARRSRTGRRLLLGLVALIVLVAGVFALYTWIALSISYSKGDRAGYVQKFSRKGWICKTWEGELAMVNLPGAMPEVFAFTVRDDAVAARLNETLGQRVALTYEEHRGIPTRCFGETGYFVTGVRALEGTVTPAAPPAAPPAPR
jgi:hypothetical protein